MKKLISILGSIAILASCGVSSVVANAEEVTMPGDITRDGVVDYYDVVGYMINYCNFLVKDGGPHLKFNSNSQEQEFLDEFRTEYEEQFDLTDEQYDILDLDKDGKLCTKDALELLLYFIDVKSGYTGEINKNDVMEYYNNVSEEIKTSVNDEFIKEMHDAGLLYTQEDWDKAEAEEAQARKERQEAILNGTAVFTDCDINNDGVLDQTDIDLMKKYKVGDVNNDGSVDSKDAVYVLKDYANSLVTSGTSNNTATASTTSKCSFFSDANRDGETDSKDAVVILKNYAESLVK